MRPIQYILEGILDDDFDVTEKDINPLLQAFRSAKLLSDNRCEFDHDQWIELWRFISPIHYKGLPAQLGCKKIPKTKFIEVTRAGDIVGIWDYKDHDITFYCNDAYYKLGEQLPHLIRNEFKIKSNWGRGGGTGYISSSGPASISDYIKRHKSECYTIPYELMKKLMDTIKVPFSKK